jgi:hypothetical protein
MPACAAGRTVWPMSTIASLRTVAADRRLIATPPALAAAKSLVLALLSATLVVPAAGGFHGEALWLRVIVYPVGLSIVPVVWRIRGRRGAYPLAADAFLLVPFAFDACGNTLGLYGNVDNFDNLSHLVGTFALAGFAGALLDARTSDRLLLGIAAAGAAGLFGIGIEVCEWTAFQHPVATGYGAYRDTIGDLGMDLAGALLGAAAVACRRSVG